MKENSFPGSLALWAGSFKPDCLFRQCRHYDTSLHKVGGQTFQGTKKRRHEIEKKKAVEGNHKPSSVVPLLLFSRNQEDGHLSRTLVAQGLKRPNPPRFSPARGGGKFEWALLSLAGTGPIWSCSGWGLPNYPDHSGYW
jgi:hypothetical protein